jgi:hypothetical protein
MRQVRKKHEMTAGAKASKVVDALVEGAAPAVAGAVADIDAALASKPKTATERVLTKGEKDRLGAYKALKWVAGKLKDKYVNGHFRLNRSRIDRYDNEPDWMCVLGALSEYYRQKDGRHKYPNEAALIYSSDGEARVAVTALQEATGTCSIFDFNDENGKAATIAACLKAAEAVKPPGVE